MPMVIVLPFELVVRDGRVLAKGPDLIVNPNCCCAQPGEPCEVCAQGTTPAVMIATIAGVVMGTGGCECLDWNKDWEIPQDPEVPCRYKAASVGWGDPTWPEVPFPCGGAIQIDLMSTTVGVTLYSNAIIGAFFEKDVEEPYDCKKIGDVPNKYPASSECNFHGATLSLSG